MQPMISPVLETSRLIFAPVAASFKTSVPASVKSLVHFLLHFGLRIVQYGEYDIREKGTTLKESAEKRSTSDAQCVARALSGESDAFGELIERYWRTAFAIALSRTGEVQAAEDVAQDAFLRAWRQLPSLRAPARFAPWLSKIVAQRATDHLRRSARAANAVQPVGDVEAHALAASPNPGLSAEEVRLVREAVGRLPQIFKDVILLRFMAGLSSKEIALRTGARAGAVRVRLHRAYKRLRKDLAL